MNIKYFLMVEVDDAQVFSGEYDCEESMLEDGLRKADYAIKEYQESIEEINALIKEGENDE